MTEPNRYTRCEHGGCHCPVYRGVLVTDLLTGDGPHLKRCDDCGLLRDTELIPCLSCVIIRRRAYQQRRRALIAAWYPPNERTRHA